MPMKKGSGKVYLENGMKEGVPEDVNKSKGTTLGTGKVVIEITEKNNKGNSKKNK